MGRMGEECLLMQMIRKLRSEQPGIHIGVISHDPAKTAKLGVEAVPGRELRAVWEAIEDCDAVIWLRSERETEWRSLGLELMVIRLAKWRKKNICGVKPQTVEQRGHFLTARAERLFRHCHRQVYYALDEQDPPHLLLSARKVSAEGLRHLQDEGIHLPQRPVAFCFHRQAAIAWVEKGATLGDTLIDRGVSLLFMPVDHFPDMEAANQVLEHMHHAAPVMRKTYAPQEWTDILADMACVLTTYPSVGAMCRGLGVPCLRLGEQQLEEMSVETVLSELAYQAPTADIHGQKT